jgi:pimeloyl-ACP methyl ester carboxylesterase
MVENTVEQNYPAPTRAQQRPLWNRLIISLLFIFILLTAAIVIVPKLYLSGSRPLQDVTLPVNGYNVHGYINPGQQPDGAWVVFVHGMRGGGESEPLYQAILHNMTNRVGVLAIDVRGYGQSKDPTLAQADNLIDRTDDVRAAIDYIEKTYGVSDDHIILVGHSLGANQVAKVAQGHRYLRVIPIGPGDFDEIISSPDGLQNHADKIKNTLDITVSTDRIRTEAAPFTPQQLYTPCPVTPVTMIGGAYEHDDGLYKHFDKIPTDCLSTFQIITIPFADHMYGTEGIPLGRLNFLQPVLQPVQSRFTISLLVWNLNRVLDDTAQRIR